ncbi:MAG: hypothetical protein WBC40_03495 [Halobacteriota archaeon]
MDTNNKVDVEVLFYLPFCLYLNDGTYSLTLNKDIEADVSLKKVRQKPCDMRLEINILSKGEIDGDAYYEVTSMIDGESYSIKGSNLKKEETGYEIHVIRYKNGRARLCLLPFYYNCELDKDERGFFRLTQVTITIRQIERYEFDEEIKYFDTALKIINRLIDVYRYVTKEYHIKKITEEDVMAYSINIIGPIDITGPRSLGYFQNGVIPLREDISPKEHLEIKRLLKDNEQIPISDLLLLDAKNFIRLGDYRRTIIESIIAIEPCIEKFVGQKLAERGVSKKHREDFFNNVTLSSQIKGLLKLLVKPEELDYQLIEDLATTNKLRNKIVHENVNVVNVSKLNAEKAINCTERIISFIRENI